MPRSFNKQRRRISTEGSKHSFSMPRRLTTQANKVVRGEAWAPEVFPQAEASALPGDVSEVVEIFCQEEAERDGFFASRLQAEFYSRLQDEDDEVVAAAAAEAEHERLCQEEAERLQAEDDEVVAAAAAEVEHEVLGRSCTRSAVS